MTGSNLENTPESYAQGNYAILVTCLVDFVRPNIGFATAKLLQDAGLTIDVPPQTCCGQPAYNAGDERSARRIACQVIEAFEPYDGVIVPSGSCAGMLSKHYPALFADDEHWRQRATALAEKTHEVLSFLKDHTNIDINAEVPGWNATYHDSCSGLRELNISHQPRELLGSVKGLSVTEMNDANVCCGFGGTFCVKYPDISTRMVDNKIDNIKASGADTLLGGDLGCLMNIAGRLRREGHEVRVFHTIEVLAGMTEPGSIAGD